MIELIIVAYLIYSGLTYRVLTTDSSDGHHKYCKSYYYTDPDTKEEMRFNDVWDGKGEETYFGWLGYGRIDFTNSFRRPTTFKYLSIMISVPGDKEIGIDIGIVRGYKGYKEGIYIGEWLIGVCPRMRWVDSRSKDRFVSLRQFGSASIKTYGTGTDRYQTVKDIKEKFYVWYSRSRHSGH